MQTFNRNIDGFYDAGYQLTLDLRRRAQIHFRRQQEEKTRIKTVADFEVHRERMHSNFLHAIGGLPGPQESSARTPLDARVLGMLERDAFTVEKIIYHALPDYPVTAACYIPKNLAEPAPAILMLQGHADIGKSNPAYQAVCIDLVNNGFVVLAVDPIGQGERHQFLHDGHLLQGGGGYEHTHAGIPFWLCGASIARHFVWDAMRGIDYLETRADVDKHRISATGSSGGGLQTCYLMLCDSRVAAAVPCTFVTTRESYQKTGQAQDAEQIIARSIVDGPDYDDYLSAIAPRPVLVGAAAYDFFPIEGAEEAVRRSKHVYELYGKAENLSLTVAPTRHEYSPHLRQACVNWFRQHLKNEPPDFITGQPEVFAEEELWATRSGEVRADFSTAKTALDLNAAALPVAPHFETPEQLRKALGEALAIEQVGERTAPIFPRVIRDTLINGYRVEKIFFFSAPDMAVTGVLIHPRGSVVTAALRATLLLLENGTDDIPRRRPQIEALLRDNQRVFVFDARGVGAVKESSDTPDMEFETFSPEYKLGCDAMMLGLSTLGLRTFDVLRAFDYLQTRDDIASIHLEGLGRGAVLAFYAAVLEPGFAELTCEDMLVSYRELCQTPDYARRIYNLKIMAWGLLKCGDVMDHLGALAPRRVTFVRPRNALGQALDETAFAGIVAESSSRHVWPDGWKPLLE